MCGIFGIILNNKNENIINIILNGLKQLQNRGYDSAGISILNKNELIIKKFASINNEDALDKLENTKNFFYDKEDIFSGIGHNRWATHGVKNDINAHPHISNNNKFAIVHNGIIENYLEIKNFLIKKGYIFYSQTDTEVIINLIEYHFNEVKDTFESIKKSIQELRGTFGLIIQSLHEPNKLFCVKNGSPILIGQNEDRVIITSEQSGFCNLVNNYITLKTDDICIIEKLDTKIILKTKNIYIKNQINISECDLTCYPFEHWTLKEIYQQPHVILNSLNNGGRIKNKSEVKLGGLEEKLDILKNINNIILLGCGTSFHACLYGMFFLKQICNFNTVQVFDGAEFNELDIPKIGNTAFILLSQSGETKDLYRCIEIAKNKNIITIGIINVVDSLIAREVDCGIYCNAGKEVGVASTKAFTSQVVCLTMTSIWFAQIHNININKRINMIIDLQNLSNDFSNTLDSCNNIIINLIKNINIHNNLFLLGKGCDEIIAREGALKIKEISYIHAEGYSSSSLKHGPFALLDENFPIILFNLDQSHYTKVMNSYHEIKSRNAPIIIITNNEEIMVENSIMQTNNIIIPRNNTFSSLLGIIPIQILAYYLSVNKGINPDKPKNLAKVVTVE